MSVDLDIAEALVSASYFVVKKKYKEAINQQYSTYQHALDFKVGRGKKTYHIKNGSRHVITYGVKMVANKLQSKKNAANWLSGREIVNMGFMGGVLTLKNCLIHTIVHEYAHYKQTLAGERLQGSVHNPAFYSIVHELYKDGLGNELSAYFDNHPALKDVCFESDSDENAPVVYGRHNVLTGSTAFFKANVIGRGRVELSGKVKRVNAKTLSLQVSNPVDQRMMLNYKVPYQLILKIKD